MSTPQLVGKGKSKGNVAGRESRRVRDRLGVFEGVSEVRGESWQEGRQADPARTWTRSASGSSHSRSYVPTPGCKEEEVVPTRCTLPNSSGIGYQADDPELRPDVGHG